MGQVRIQALELTHRGSDTQASIMIPSSRTPEGERNCCPLCGQDVCVEVSFPAGDAPCPHCGHLLWFAEHGERDVVLRRIVNRASDSVDKRDAPALVALQFVGLVGAISVTVLFGAWMLTAIAVLIARSVSA